MRSTKNIQNIIAIASSAPFARSKDQPTLQFLAGQTFKGMIIYLINIPLHFYSSLYNVW